MLLLVVHRTSCRTRSSCTYLVSTRKHRMRWPWQQQQQQHKHHRSMSRLMTHTSRQGKGSRAAAVRTHTHTHEPAHTLSVTTVLTPTSVDPRYKEQPAPAVFCISRRLSCGSTWMAASHLCTCLCCLWWHQTMRTKGGLHAALSVTTPVAPKRPRGQHTVLLAALAAVCATLLLRAAVAGPSWHGCLLHCACWLQLPTAALAGT